MVDFQTKPKYAFEDLVRIVKLLRSPEGCPWDREQDHKSIRSNLIEETYEAVEAIDISDPVLLEEELGDVLLQVVFHAQMEAESGSFSIGEVIDGICKKLIVRHPHVFGDVQAQTSEQVLKNWDEIKKQTKGQHTQSEVMKTIPRVFPALMRSSKVQQKAAKAGFDWPDIRGAIEKTREELSELEEALEAGDPAHSREELGDLLFSAVNISRFMKTDPEEALTESCDKFISRFSAVEKAAGESGRNMKDMTPEELDRLWNQAKKAL